MEFTPYSLPLLVTAGITSLLALVIWRRRPGSSVIPFVVLHLGLCQWTLSTALEYSITNLDTRLFFNNFAFVGITTVPGAWMAFSMTYTGRDKWLTRRNVGLLLIEPVLIALLALTNQYHYLFRTDVRFDFTTPVVSYESGFGPAFWLHAVYSYTVLLTGTLVLVNAAYRSPKIYRQQYTMLLIGSVIPWIANILYVFKIVPIFIDPTPFAFTLTGILMGWSIYRYRLMDIVPVARATVIEHMNDAIMVLDRENRIVDVNPTGLKIMGAASASDVTGQLAGTALPAAFAPLIEQYRMTPEAQSEITVGTGENQRHFEMRISPIRNRQDELTGRLFVVHEITALKQASAQIQGQNERLTQINQELAVAREQAEESNRLKSEFLATMSHELRTPLNSVIGYTDVMLTGLVGSFTEKQTDYLKRVMANGERLLSLINDILDISKIEAGRLELVQHAYNLQDLLNGVKAQMQSLAEQKSLPFNTYFDPLLPVEVVGDPKRLEQILINLVSNAIRFTDTGSVEIRFEKIDSASWALLVRDTGSGIPPHALEYIFDEFRQVDMSTHREHGGTGLGLSIVRKLVILMNGTIQVQSEVGKGSVFRVQLPLIVPEVQVVH